MAFHPSRHLRQVLVNLNFLEEYLRPGKLEPATLQWEKYLENAKELAKQFQSLIESIPQELRHFVAYPVRHEPPLPNLGIDALLCPTEIPELTSEAAVCKQRYNDQMKEDGLSASPPDVREEILSNRIHDHNTLCERVGKEIHGWIEEKGLGKSGEQYVRMSPPRTVPCTILEAILVTGERLPVPNDFELGP
jgi:hypothetical protein